MKNFEVECDQMRSLETNVVCSWVSSQDAMPSKSKKRRVVEDDELGNVSSKSFDNVSMAIDTMIDVMAKCFAKSYGAEIHTALGVLDLDPTSKIEAWIFLMENTMYKKMFFGCPNLKHKGILLTLMPRSQNY